VPGTILGADRNPYPLGAYILVGIILE